MLAARSLARQSLRSVFISASPVCAFRKMTDFQPPAVFAENRQQQQRAISTPAGTATAAQSGNEGVGTKITSHNQYHTDGIEESDLLPNPLPLFQRWFDAANREGAVREPEAMVVSTCDTPDASSQSQRPPRTSSRVVLLKSIHPQEGLTFYSNYTSRKAREMASNPHVSAVFYWRETHQSVRFLGKVKKVGKAESQEYFDSRPVGSRVGAWASPQSQVILGGRQELEAKVREQEQRFGVPGAAGLEGKQKEEEAKLSDGVQIPVPDHWGGYRIEPYEVEFWCGRPNRLHDRFRYTRDEKSSKLAGDDSWTIQRLAP